MNLPFANIVIPVEFDDMDAGGVVYHPNYLKLCERVRNRWLGQFGADFLSMQKQDIGLAVKSIKADFRRAIRQGNISVKMEIIDSTPKSLTILHKINPIEKSHDEGVSYFSAEIKLVSFNYSTWRSCSLPQGIKNLLNSTK